MTLAKWQKLASQSSSTLSNSVLIGSRSSPPFHGTPDSIGSHGDSSSEVTLLEESLRDLEEVRSTLVDENTELRNLIASVEGGLGALLLAQSIQPANTWNDHVDVHLFTEPHLVLSPNLLEGQLDALVFQMRDLLEDKSAEILVATERGRFDGTQEKRVVELANRVSELEADLGKLPVICLGLGNEKAPLTNLYSPSPSSSFAGRGGSEEDSGNSLDCPNVSCPPISKIWQS